MEAGNRERTIARLVKRDTFKSVIWAKCAECIYDDDSEGSWKKQVQDCTSQDCPLYNKRPMVGQQ